MRFTDLIGSTFGFLTVIGPGGWYTSPRGHRRRLALCSCVCGNTIKTRTSSLRSGHAISCGCAHDEARARGGRNRRTHGESRNRYSRNYVPEYVAWSAMIQCCTNPNDKRWKWYGGRGIKVSDRWLNSYEAFLADVGRRPSPLHSLGRYPDNDGNYEPGNVRWMTRSELARKRRSSGCVRVSTDKTRTERHPTATERQLTG